MEKTKINVTGLDVKIGIAVAICLLTAKLIPEIQYMAACFAAILCMQDEVKVGWKTGVIRVTLTAVAGITGVAIILLNHAIGNEWIFIVLVLFGVILTLWGCKLEKVPYITARLGALTFVLIVMMSGETTGVKYAVMRLAGTFYGVLVSLAITWIFGLFRLKKRNKAEISSDIPEEAATALGTAKRQVFNPYLPLNEYIPDGEPHVFEGRLYIFGSHDEEGGDKFCPLDYVAWSAPEHDLSDWTSHGVIYRKEQDPANKDGSYRLYAPDVVRGKDGRYYLFYCLDLIPQISVAVCDEPAGKYEYLGTVHYPDGVVLKENMPFDPAVINDDGQIYLYYGFAPTFQIHGDHDKNCPGCSCALLEDDMLTVKQPPVVVIPSKEYAKGTGFEEHAFFEAASVRRINGTYYLVYSSAEVHELCYAVSSYPNKNFTYGGVVISNGDVGIKGRSLEESVWAAGNNHGGLVEAGGRWYIFYHRHTHGTMFSRQGCAEPVVIDDEGRIRQVEMTSSGLTGAPLEAAGEYPAAIACNLWGENGAKSPVFGKITEDAPIISSEGGKQFISQMEAGTVIGYKYFRFKGKTNISLTYRGNATGSIEIRDSYDGKVLTAVTIAPAGTWTTASAELDMEGDSAMFLRYHGTGSMQLLSFRFDS